MRKGKVVSQVEADRAKTDIKGDGNFSGTLADWDMRVFDDAVSFTVFRFHGQGNRDSAERVDFREALTIAGKALLDKSLTNCRVIVYAVSASKRWVVIPQPQWLPLLRRWDAKQKEAR